MKSPCVRLCQLINKTTHMECVGCGRTQEEIMLWTRMTDEARDEVMKRLSNNKWVVEVQQDGKTKELFIEFPEDALNQVGWDEGDTLLWEELPDGSWSVTKKE